jgi:hypothetical protein
MLKIKFLLNKKKYVLPIIPRAGLGHGLFTWAEAYRIGKNYNAEFIHPHWFRVRIGPYIRREKEKMLYRSIMKTPDWGVGPYIGRFILPFLKKNNGDLSSFRDQEFIICKDNPPHSFSNLIEIREELKIALSSISRIEPSDPVGVKKPFICVEYRSGDYKWLANKNGFFKLSVREQREVQMCAFTGLDFFIDAVKTLREIAGWNVPVVLSTDAYHEEISDLIELGSVTLARSDSPLLKMLEMSEAAITVIGSSNFAAWSWFLGNAIGVFPVGRRDFLYGLGLKHLPHATYLFDDENELIKEPIKSEIKFRLAQD